MTQASPLVRFPVVQLLFVTFTLLPNGKGRGQRQESNVEVKYTGPDGIMIDVSETGWDGTSRA